MISRLTETRPAHAAHRVLLVEDDPDVAAGIADLLSADGFDVDHVQLGGRAERAVETFRPDVVLLDVRLPDISGAEVFRILRSRWPELAIVFSSGHVNSLAEVGAIDAARVALLRKPYDGATLIETILNIMK
jgi:two-component system C4-dicarboxylate transport response regulator DctD